MSPADGPCEPGRLRWGWRDRRHGAGAGRMRDAPSWAGEAGGGPDRVGSDTPGGGRSAGRSQSARSERMRSAIDTFAEHPPCGRRLRGAWDDIDPWSPDTGVPLAVGPDPAHRVQARLGELVFRGVRPAMGRDDRRDRPVPRGTDTVLLSHFIPVAGRAQAGVCEGIYAPTVAGSKGNTA